MMRPQVAPSHPPLQSIRVSDPLPSVHSCEDTFNGFGAAGAKDYPTGCCIIRHHLLRLMSRLVPNRRRAQMRRDSRTSVLLNQRGELSVRPRRHTGRAGAAVGVHKVPNAEQGGGQMAHRTRSAASSFYSSNIAAAGFIASLRMSRSSDHRLLCLSRFDCLVLLRLIQGTPLRVSITAGSALSTPQVRHRQAALARGLATDVIAAESLTRSKAPPSSSA